MNVHPVSWQNFVHVFAVLALISSPAFGQGKNLVIPFGDEISLVADVSTNDAGNLAWDIGIAGINENAVAVELAFEGLFVDLPSPVGDGTVDDSILANNLFLLGVFDAPNDSHYRRAPPNLRGGFDTENPGNNPFTGEVTNGWYQNDNANPTQIFISLGSSRNQDPVIPLAQLITPPGNSPVGEFFVQGTIAQNRGDAGDSFVGGGVLSIPEPTSLALAGLTLLGCLVGAGRRRS